MNVDQTYDRLYRVRHSAAHVLATAMLDLFPDAQMGIGPPTDDGFYYDFELPRALTPDDLKALQKLMLKHKKANYPFEYSEHDREAALAYFEETNQPFKVELINDLPDDETISYYTSGPFVDLCRGPHVDSTGEIGAFKLLSIAGAYWRGDENRAQLQRVYGTAFETKAELNAHLARLEEAKRRDHRTLARDLDLFSINPAIGAGLVLWHAKGSLVRELLETFWREEHRRRGYDMVYSPHIGRRELWETSGHTQWFSEGLFPEMELEHQTFINKPMNCPFHVKIFDSQTRSYRDLPLRYGELGTVYRFERSGTLHGALRVRGLTQDDAHIFCRRDQFTDEVAGALDLAKFIYETFGFSEYIVELSVRDASGSAKYAGGDDLWELAEEGLVEALERHEMAYTRVEGEAAFYGPKIDIQVADAIGRRWQLTTVQVDFNLPERFDITYEDADGTRQRPVMVHRAIFRGDGALRGGADRALCGGVPGVAGAGAGGGDPDCGPACRLLRRRGRAAARGRLAGAGGRAGRAHEPEDPGRAAAEDAVHADRGGSRHQGREGFGPAADRRGPGGHDGGRAGGGRAARG